MAFESIDLLLARLNSLGAKRVFCKRLAENDNSKQQIYLGSSFEVLSFFPFGEIIPHSDLKYPNFKASLELYWVEPQTIEQAKGAQLILYPAYPEVRLSGFLAGCKTAPSAELRPIPAESRRGQNGRVVVFGTTQDGKTLIHLAGEGTPLAQELLARFPMGNPISIFTELTLPVGSMQNRNSVLQALKDIHAAGFHPSCRRDKFGDVMPYKARNGGGYTLEALLGITPNGHAEPDFLGWEIKAHSKNRVTLMTPEPNGGFYGTNGAKAFVEKYGHDTEAGDKYFTGLHRVGSACPATGLSLVVAGFDSAAQKLVDVGGSIRLLDSEGNEAASWAFAQLLTHWNRKHAFAAYVPYTSDVPLNAYRFDSPVFMCEHTDFNRYLSAMCSGVVVFDPGSKVENPGTPKATIKARSQFRTNIKDLHLLYENIGTEVLS